MSRQRPIGSKFSNPKPNGSITRWQLAQLAFSRWISSCFRKVKPSCFFLVSSKLGTFGGRQAVDLREYSQESICRVSRDLFHADWRSRLISKRGSAHLDVPSANSRESIHSRGDSDHRVACHRRRDRTAPCVLGDTGSHPNTFKLHSVKLCQARIDIGEVSS